MTTNSRRTPVRTLGLTAALIAALTLAAPAGATTNPDAHALVRCWDGGARAQFEYLGFSPRWHLTATQTISVNGAVAGTKTYMFSGPVGADAFAVALPAGTVAVRAATVVVGAAGRVKATAEAEIVCTKPPPPPPVRVRPSASFQGPCGDPFYRAVLNNLRSARAVTFRVSYQPFGEPRKTFARRVGAHKRLVTHWFDVAGLTRMTVRAEGRLLRSQLSAPNRVYRACW